MSLQFLLPDCPGFGVYQLDTSSYHSIVNINSMLELIRSTCQRVSMLPLVLRLVPKEVQVEGEDKVVHVLELGTLCSLSKMQEYARIPPGQVMLVPPPPDSEAPDDLFPHAVERPGEPVDRLSGADGERLELWWRARRLIEELGICDVQIEAWFRNEQGCRVNLVDFCGEVPPQRLTTEQLRRFCEAVERCRPES